MYLPTDEKCSRCGTPLSVVLFEAHPSRADVAVRIVQCVVCGLVVTTEVSISEHKPEPGAVTVSPREVIRPRAPRRKAMTPNDPNKPQDPKPAPTDPNKPGR